MKSIAIDMAILIANTPINSHGGEDCGFSSATASCCLSASSNNNSGSLPSAPNCTRSADGSAAMKRAVCEILAGGCGGGTGPATPAANCDGGTDGANDDGGAHDA